MAAWAPSPTVNEESENISLGNYRFKRFLLRFPPSSLNVSHLARIRLAPSPVFAPSMPDRLPGRPFSIPHRRGRCPDHCHGYPMDSK